MLNIIFGEDNIPLNLKDRFVPSLGEFFRRHKQPTWFENPEIVDMLYTVDDVKVIHQEAMLNYRGRAISPCKLSFNAAVLCCLYYYPEIITLADVTGKGVPMLVKLSRKYNLTVVFEGFVDLPSDIFTDNLVMCNSTLVTEHEYENAYSTWCTTLHRD